MKRKLQGKPVCLSFMDSGVGGSLCPGFIVLFFEIFCCCLCFQVHVPCYRGIFLNSVMDILVQDLLGESKVGCP